MNSIRSMTASLAVVVALTASASIEAQSTPAYTPPAERGISRIATKQQQDEVMTLMAAYLGLWSTEDPGRYAFEQSVTDDAVFEYPYADEGYQRVEGRKAIGQALRKLSATASNWRFTGLTLYETLYPHVFFVEYTAKAYVPTTRNTYESRHIGRVTVKDGKIADYHELWERDAKAAAFGTIADVGCVPFASAHEAIN
jgi:ketosteroid isomerase-like protein